MDHKKIYVVKKIDIHSIIINKGLIDDINNSMRFLVYEEGDEIFDFITNNSLGLLEIPKGFFKVKHIQEKMTILVSELKKDNKLINFDIFEDVDADKQLLASIKIGDKVKIINEF